MTDQKKNKYIKTLEFALDNLILNSYKRMLFTESLSLLKNRGMEFLRDNEQNFDQDIREIEQLRKEQGI